MIAESFELNRWRKLKTKIKLTVANVGYLKRCRSAGLFPSFMSGKIRGVNNARRYKAEHAKKLVWLREEISFQYSILEVLNLQLYQLHLRITRSLTNVEFAFFKAFTSEFEEILAHKLSVKMAGLEKKFLALKPKQTQTDSIVRTTKPLPGFVKNLSSQEFSDIELGLLENGLNYALQPARPPLEEVVADVESCIRRLPYAEKESVRSEVRDILARPLRAQSSVKHRSDRRTVRLSNSCARKIATILRQTKETPSLFWIRVNM